MKLDFNTAAQYPFKKPSRLCYILYFFIPIFGWFALGGLKIRIIQEFCKGKYKQVPQMSFWSDCKKGAVMFLKMIPFMILYMITIFVLTVSIPLEQSMGWLVLYLLTRIILEGIILPMLIINFFVKEKMDALFEFEVVPKVFANIKYYVAALFMEIMLSIVFLVLSIVLVGIPAGLFTKNIFLARFYKDFVQ